MDNGVRCVRHGLGFKPHAKNIRCAGLHISLGDQHNRELIKLVTQRDVRF